MATQIFVNLAVKDLKSTSKNSNSRHSREGGNP